MVRLSEICVFFFLFFSVSSSFGSFCFFFYFLFFLIFVSFTFELDRTRIPNVKPIESGHETSSINFIRSEYNGVEQTCPFEIGTLCRAFCSFRRLFVCLFIHLIPNESQSITVTEAKRNSCNQYWIPVVPRFSGKSLFPCLSFFVIYSHWKNWNKVLKMNFVHHVNWMRLLEKKSGLERICSRNEFS